MKKSIIAIAFLLLCPFYGVRAQERPFFDLSGKGWHLWQDKKCDLADRGYLFDIGRGTENVL